VFAGPDFLRVVEGMFSKCDITEFQQFVGVARRIWLWRNGVVHGGLFLHPNTIFKQALMAMEEFKKVFDADCIAISLFNFPFRIRIEFSLFH
jgi:hypothetical protein